ncbi:copper chaperone PCu(A)C [Caenimonas terrae]|uniref:Copper chaperone PCu(A)C n=1 Tax=Caenimonas terrae TaxID=696074 RepID=A0ABW0NDQ5_9BURK
MNTSFKTLCSLALCFAAPAFAHVSLQHASADAGSSYQAVLRVGHGCDGSPTTAVSVQLPAGFADPQPQPKAGWTLERRGNEVTWTAADKQSALPAHARTEFTIAGKLPATPGPLWLKVRQTCEQGRIDWGDVPARGTSTEGMKTPAVLLLVQAPAAVKVEQGWVRPSVPGQQGTGGYMLLTAREGQRLVGVSSPVAGVAEIHEMKMEGEVMKMRPAGPVELPAGKTVELKPGGLHLMLMDLKQPLAAGSSVPVTLVLKDGHGVESRVETQLVVGQAAPGAAPAADVHKH